MSTTTVSYRSTARNVRLAELRRQEAAARDAARQAAQQRAERRRREEDATRRRMAAADRTIAAVENRFQALVARLDDAAGRLPDLTLAAPTLSALTSDIARDPTALEQHASRVSTEVQQFERRLDAALAQAEVQLRRRLAKAAAWREVKDLTGQIGLHRQANRDIAALLNEALAGTDIPQPPAEDAELEVVEAHLAALRVALTAESDRNMALEARRASRQRAAALAGTAQSARNADESLSQYEARLLETARKALQDRIGVALHATGQRLNDLSGEVQMLIDDALAQAARQDQGDRVTRLIAREKEMRDGVAQALALVNNPPDLAYADPKTAQRWVALLSRLQRVAGNLDAFSPILEREYEQIAADAGRARNAAFSKADWLRAMSEQGFEVLERDDGAGLVVVDLNHPDVWLDATEIAADGARSSGFGAILELKTDAGPIAGPQDTALQEAMTADICARLAKATDSRPDITSAAEVIERKSRITRERRPAKARRALAHDL